MVAHNGVANMVARIYDSTGAGLWGIVVVGKWRMTTIGGVRLCLKDQGWGCGGLWFLADGG